MFPNTILFVKPCHRECNNRGNVIEVLNEFYAAVFCHIFLIWSHQQKTIVDAGYILKGIKNRLS